jgi:subtilisin-like proprotein convertase family protein
MNMKLSGRGLRAAGLSLLNSYRSFGRDRTSRKARSSALSAVGRAVEVLEKRMLMSGDPLVSVLSRPTIAGMTAGDGNNTFSSPAIAVNPMDPARMVAVSVNRNVATATNSASYVFRISRNGGNSWLAPTGGLQVPVLARWNDTDQNESFQLVTDVQLGFDRLNNVYMLSLERTTDGNHGALVLRKFQFGPTDASPTVVDINPDPNLDFSILYSWSGTVGSAGSTDAVVSPNLTVSQNLRTFTDPITTATITDTNVDAATGQGPIYVSFATSSSIPANVNPASFNPNAIINLSSTDGGVTFAAASVAGGLGDFFGNQRNVTPKTTVNRGTAGAGGITPGQLDLFWVDTGSNNRPGIADPTDLIQRAQLSGSSAALRFVDINPAGAPVPLPSRVDTAAQVVEINRVINVPALPAGVLSFDNFSLEVAIETTSLLQGVEIILTSPLGEQITLLRNGVNPAGQAVQNAGATGNNLGIVEHTGTGVILPLGTVFGSASFRSVRESAEPYVGYHRPEGGTVEQFMAAVRGNPQNPPNPASYVGDWTVTIRQYGTGTVASSIRSLALTLSNALSVGQTTVNLTETRVRTVPAGTSVPPNLFTFNNTGAFNALPDRGVGPGLVVASDNTIGDRGVTSVLLPDGTRQTVKTAGSIYVAYVDVDANAPQDNTDIKFVTITPGGALIANAKVNDDSGQSDGFSGAFGSALGRPQFMPQLAVDQTNGNVALSFYDARWDAARVRVSTHIAVSRDGGRTFLPQTFANQPNTATDAVIQATDPNVSATVTLGPIPDNFTASYPRRDLFTAGGNGLGLGTEMGLAAANGRIFPMWIGNQNGGQTPGATNRYGVNYAIVTAQSGPRIVSSDMGPVTTAQTQLVSVVDPNNNLVDRFDTVTYNGSLAADGRRQITHLLLQFDRYVDATSVTNGAVTVFRRTPSSPGSQPASATVAVSQITPLYEDRNGRLQQVAHRFLLQLAAPQSEVGTYSYVVAPSVRDAIRFFGQHSFVSSTFTAGAGTVIQAGTPPVAPAVNPTPAVTSLTNTVGGIAANARIVKARVLLSLNFPDLGVLRMQLVSPTGAVVTLLNGLNPFDPVSRNGLTGSRISNAQFSPDGTRQITATGNTQPYTGIWFSNTSSLVQTNPNGDWTLHITNVSTGGGAGAGTSAQVGAFTLWLDYSDLTGAVNTAPASGNQMDQNQDGYGGLNPVAINTTNVVNPAVPGNAEANILGLAGGDAYSAPAWRDGTAFRLTGDFRRNFEPDTQPLIVPGPFVVSVTPRPTDLTKSTNTGIGTTPLALNTTLSTVRVVFDRNIDPASFTAASILRLSGPAGLINGPQRYTSPQANQVIPDSSIPRRVLDSSIVIRDDYRIGDANVQIGIAHPRVGDLQLTLIAPDGTEVRLVSNLAQSGSNFQNTIFDDTSTFAIGSAQAVAPYNNATGYRPEVALSTLNLKNSRGQWRLRVEDTVAGTSAAAGSLTYWSLVLTPDVSSFTVTPTTNAAVFDVGFPTQSFSGAYNLTLAPTIRSATGGDRLDSNLNAGLATLRDSVAAAAAGVISTQYNSTNVPIILPANAGSSTVESTILLPAGDSFAVQSASVQLNIAHTDVPSLTADLVAPDGTTVRLFSGVGTTGSRTNFSNTIFSDNNPAPAGITPTPATPIANGAAPFQGTFAPAQSLTGALAGKPSVSGVVPWRLVIRNASGTVAGQLNSWSLTLGRNSPTTGLGEAVGDDASLAFRMHQFDRTNPTSSNAWTEFGPQPADTATTPSRAGRVGAIAVDPSDPTGNTVFAAGATGGVFKTRNFLSTTGQPHWVPLTGSGPTGSLNVGSVAVFARNNDSNQSIVIVGTGDADTNRGGVGFLRSTDGGASWQILDSSSNFDAAGNLLPLDSGLRNRIFVGATVYRVVVDPRPTPAGEQIIFAALGGPNPEQRGIWRSLDSGRTWQRVLSRGAGAGTLPATDVILDTTSGFFDTISNPNGNLQYVYGAFAGDGVFFSPNRGSSWNELLGGVGNPLKIDASLITPTNPNGRIPTNNPSDSPDGVKARITLAKPAATSNALKNFLYQGWLYALVATPTSQALANRPADPKGALADYNGLYMTKDFGQNWTRVDLAADRSPRQNQPEFDYIPSNDSNGFDFRGLGTNLAARGNYNNALAVDPLNPSVVFIGGDKLFRVDTTGVGDPHSLYLSQNNANLSLFRNSTGPAPLRTVNTEPTSPGFSPATSPFINLVQNPSNPFASNTTIGVKNTLRFNNDGTNAKWVEFGTGTMENSSEFQDIVTIVDPITGATRVIAGNGQGVYSVLDDGTPNGVIPPRFLPSPVGSRNGNLGVAPLFYGAANPGLASANGNILSYFYTGGESIGAPRSAINPIDTGNLVWTGPAGSAGGTVVSQVATQQSWYQQLWPSNNDGTTAANFFTASDISRVTGLIQDDNVNFLTGDTQWPDFGQLNVAINPVNPNNLLIASASGRLFATGNEGRIWAVIAEPNQIGINNPGALFTPRVPAMAFGAPDPNGPGGADATGNLIYVGTANTGVNAPGQIFVTFTGGGAVAGSWTNLSAGLDGSTVRSIVTSPTRGTYQAYAVTDNGVFFMPDSRVANPQWTNITANLRAITGNAFGDPNASYTRNSNNAIGAGLLSLQADWRYRIPFSPALPNQPNLTFPVLYVGGAGGVYRSLDNGASWAVFPNILSDDSLVDGGLMPSVQVTDLDLSLGPVDPTTGFPNSALGENLLMASTYGRGVFAIRVAPLVIPQALTIDPLTDTGVSNSDFISQSQTPRFFGRSAATAFGNTVSVQLFNLTDPLNPVAIGAAVQTDTFGAFTITVPQGSLPANGVIPLGFQATDGSGAKSAFFQVVYSVDNTAPAAPSVTRITAASDTGISNSDGITRNNRPTIVGRGEAGSLVTIRSGTTVIGTATTTDTGDWALTPTTNIADGTFQITATQSDLAGNNSAGSAAIQIQVITALPATPAAPDLDAASDTGPNNTDNITSDTTPTVIGTTIPNGIVRILRGNIELGTATANGSGAYTFTITPALASGQFAVTATVDDIAGNRSAVSAPLNFEINNAQPPTPVVPRVQREDDTGASDTDGITSVRAPRISGAVRPNHTVSLFLGSSTTPLATNVADGQGNFTVLIPSQLADGIYSIRITQTDGAGNTSELSNPITLTVDTTAPAVTAVDIVGTKRQLFSGQVATFTDANPNGSAAITWGDGNSSGGAIVLGTPNSVTGANTFNRSGTFNFNVTVTDLAGNTASDDGQAVVAGNPVDGVGGQVLQLTEATDSGTVLVGTFTDPGGDEPLASYAAVINWGDGTASTPATISPNPNAAGFIIEGTHRYGEDSVVLDTATGQFVDRPYVITITITTGGANPVVITSSASVANQPVQLTPSTITATAGQPFSGVVATFLDAGDSPAVESYSGTIDWNDGTTPSLVVEFVRDTTNPKLFSAVGAHTFTESGSFSVTVTINNEGGAPASIVSDATVANVSPVVGISGQSVVFAASPATFTLSATDVSNLDTAAGFSYLVDFGDNSTPVTVAATAGNGSGVNIQHTYAAGGSFTITVTATDRLGAASAPVTFPITVAIPPTLSGVTVNDVPATGSVILPNPTLVAFTISAGGAPLPVITVGQILLIRNASENRPLDAASFTFNSASGVGSINLGALNLPNGDYELRIAVPNGPSLPILFTRLRGDLNGSGLVDSADLRLVTRALKATTGGTGFIPDADYNGNGVIDSDDVKVQRSLNGTRISRTVATYVFNPLRPRVPVIKFSGRIGNFLGQDLVIRNPDKARPLVLSNLNFSGNPQLSFAVVGQTSDTKSVVIPAGGSITLRFYLTPVSRGTAVASATFNLGFQGTTAVFFAAAAEARIR